MRGGNNRGGVKVSASNRRRRDRYTRSTARDSWGVKRPLIEDDCNDDDPDPPR
jgi:hypothetical protein